MKQSLIALVCLACFVPEIIIAQRTLVAPKKVDDIRPNNTSGDLDFFGHGPAFTASVSIRQSSGGGQLIADINCSWQETAKDSSRASVNTSRIIYEAPAGKRIARIVSPATLRDNSSFTFTRQGANRIRGQRGGPVLAYLVRGDGDGDDIGNDPTQANCSVQFNAVVVELENLPADVKEFTIKDFELAGTLSEKFSGIRGRINTYGPEHNQSWFKANDSWIILPPAISSESKPDTILISGLEEIIKSSRRYNFNDINLSSQNVRSLDEYLQLTLNWESDGPEAIGHCVNDIGCGLGTPTLQVDDLKVQIKMRLEVANGTLGFSPDDLHTKISYKASADCGGLTDLCNAIFNGPIKNSLYRAQNSLTNQLNRTENRRRITTSLNNGVKSYLASQAGVAAHRIEFIDFLSRKDAYVIRYRLR